VLSHLAILYSPEIIEGCGSAAKRSFGYSQNVVALSKDLMSSIIDYLNSLLAKCFQRCSKSGQAVCNTLGVFRSAHVVFI
jgi:hypothetical protein